MLLFVVVAIACATLACCLYRSGQLRAWYRQLSVTLGFRRSLWPPYFYTNVRGRACTELADSDVVLGAYWDDLHTWFTDESGSEERLYRGPIIVPFVETVKDAEPLVAVLQSLWALLHLTTKYSYIKHAVPDARQITFVSHEIIAFAKAHGCSCLTSPEQVDAILQGASGRLLSCLGRV